MKSGAMPRWLHADFYGSTDLTMVGCGIGTKIIEKPGPPGIHLWILVPPDGSH